MADYVGRPDKNTLPPGTSRLGFLFDGDERTEHMAALLENDGEGIVLTIPWHREYGEGYRRWFHGERTQFGDDPEREKWSYEVPSTLLFQDSAGTLALVGCRRGGFNEQLWAVGAGRVLVDYVVLGAQERGYDAIHGLRSEIGGLSDWMHISSIQNERETDASGRLRKASLHLAAPGPEKLRRPLQTRLTPSWKFGDHVEDQILIEDRMFVETTSVEPTTWLEHIHEHRDLRDLLRVASWRKHNFRRHEVMKDDDPERALNREPMGSVWRPVVTHRGGLTAAAGSPRDRYLFDFRDIGTAGLARWFTLAETFSRGVLPILSTLEYTNAAESMVAEVGIGFEALGFQIAIEQGMSRSKADGLSHHAYCLLVGGELKTLFPFDDLDDWATFATRCYSSVKHAKRDMPDPAEALESWRQCVLVFRLWVARRLGAKVSNLRHALDMDGLARTRYWVED